MKGHALLNTIVLGGAPRVISHLDGGVIILAPLLQLLQVDASDGTLVWLGRASGTLEHELEVPLVPLGVLAVGTDVTRLPNRPPAGERLHIAQRANQAQVSSAENNNFTLCASLPWGQGVRKGGLDVKLLLAVLSVLHVRRHVQGTRSR